MATNPGDSGGQRVTSPSLVSGAATVTFAARYEFIEIKNLDTTNPMFVTTNGTAPAGTGGPDQYEAGPGERILVPNQAPLWWQGYGAADGTMTNPGAMVALATATATAKFEVLGVG